MTVTFIHNGGNINTVTITFTYNSCVTQLDSDNKYFQTEWWKYLQTLVTTMASVCAIVLKLWVGLGWVDIICSLLATSLHARVPLKLSSLGNYCACVIIVTNSIS